MLLDSTPGNSAISDYPNDQWATRGEFPSGRPFEGGKRVFPPRFAPPGHMGATILPSGVVVHSAATVADIVTASDVLAWRQCIQATLKLASHRPAGADDSYPNSSAIWNALAWLNSRQFSHANQPPTLITFEPAGGLIVERRSIGADGNELHIAWTFYNDGQAEVTEFRDGRLTRNRFFDLVPARSFV